MNKKFILTNLFFIFYVFTPLVATAASGTFTGTGLADLLGEVGNIVRGFFPVMTGLAVAFFFWGIGQFILHANDPKLRTDGRNKMIWGFIALFVLVSIFGILQFIGASTDIMSASLI